MTLKLDFNGRRADGRALSFQQGVMQLLSWEPASGNRMVVFALVQKGEAAGEEET